MQMRKITYTAAALAAFSLSTAAMAEESDPREVVVTATRVETPIEETGSSVTVLSADDLARTQTRTVADALRQVPGVAVTRTGGPGQSSFVRLRGTPPGFTQVMVDGMKINDPAGIGTLYDFGNFNVDNVERIEILRGPQSTLYGSDAMAGVINIITRKGEGAPSSYVDVEGGSYETWRIGAGSSGEIDRFNYSVSVSHFDTDGIPATDAFSERDGYRNQTFSTRLGYQLTDDASVSLFARYIDSDIDYDSVDASFMPSPEGKIEKEELFVRGETEVLLLDGLWEQKVGIGHSRLRRDFLESPGLPDQSFDGDVTQADWQHNLYWSELHTFTLGADWERNEAKTTDNPAEDMHTLGFFAQDRISVGERWFTTLGVRLDDNNEFGSETTYRAASAYHVQEWGSKLKASYGTGFKAPSLFELFAESPFVVGNPNLDAQTSRGWDVGVEQEIVGELLSAGVTYFEIKFDDLIEWTPGADEMSPGTYRNVDSAKTQGVEAFLASRWADYLSARVDYTHLDGDKTTGAFALQRPSDRFVGRVTVYPLAPLSVTLLGEYVGARDDVGDVRLDAYTLVHLAAAYELSDRWTVYGRVENLFDESYEEAAGYNTPGVAGYGGVRATF